MDTTVGSALKRTLPSLVPKSPEVSTQCQPSSATSLEASDGQTSVSGPSGQTSAGTGQVLTPTDPSKRIGQAHGRTGAVARTNAPSVTALLAELLPSQILSWLSEWARLGWQAKAPEATPELVGALSPLMNRISGQLWKAPTTPEENAALINEVMTTLSVYGYGALPSDPAHADAKIGGFCDVLETCPLWAVQEAGAAWRKEKTQPPTPAEWLSDARRAMGWYLPCIGGETTGRVFEKLTAWCASSGGNH